MKRSWWKTLIVVCIFWAPVGVVTAVLGFPVTTWQYWAIWGAAMSTAIGEMIVSDMKR